MLLLRNGDLLDLVPIDAAMSALRVTLTDQAAGDVTLPPRITLDAAAGAWLRLMPVLYNRRSVMGFKSMNVTPGHGVRTFIALVDVPTGNMFALLDADYITALRTAATVAIATDLFAPDEIEAMTLLGSGMLAEYVLTAIAMVRRLPLVFVYSPNAEHRTTFAERLTARTGIDVHAVPSTRAAIRASNLITGAFRAPDEPSIRADDVQSGTHINSLSSVRADAREVAAEVWRACTCIFLDNRAGVAQSGDGMSILRDHPFDLERAPELWEVVRDGRHRTIDDNVTMFKAVGAASQDITVAMLAYDLAVAAGLGEELADFPSVRYRR